SSTRVKAHQTNRTRTWPPLIPARSRSLRRKGVLTLAQSNRIRRQATRLPAQLPPPRSRKCFLSSPQKDALTWQRISRRSSAMLIRHITQRLLHKEKKEV